MILPTTTATASPEVRVRAGVVSRTGVNKTTGDTRTIGIHSRTETNQTPRAFRETGDSSRVKDFRKEEIIMGIKTLIMAEMADIMKSPSSSSEFMLVKMTSS